MQGTRGGRAKRWIRVSCRVANEEPPERKVIFGRNDAQGWPTQLCAETCCNGKYLTSEKSQVCFLFLVKREDDAFDDDER